MREARPFEVAVEQWDSETAANRVAEADELRTEFTETFPLDEWPSMPLERYALGQEQEREKTYSWWLEYNTLDIGSIKGGSAHKHLIWKAKNGWRYPEEYENVGQAWEEVRSGFVEAFRLASEERFGEIPAVSAIPETSTVLCKSLYLYFPDRLLPIFSRDHLNHFLKLLDDSGSSSATVEANRRLTEVVAKLPAFQEMSHQEIMYFLYDWSHPSPSRSTYKIAPGPDASEWKDCRDNGYIAVGEPVDVADDDVVSFEWSPNGEALLYQTIAEGDLVPHVWDGEDTTDFAGYQPTNVLVSQYLPFWSQYSQTITQWSPDGSSFVYAAGNEEGEGTVWIQPLDGERVRVGSGEMAVWSR